eukprot:1597049-Rhodomonas_salina.2
MKPKPADACGIKVGRLQARAMSRKAQLMSRSDGHGQVRLVLKGTQIGRWSARPGPNLLP